MKLNTVERFLINNPLRRITQVYYEAPLLLRMGGSIVGTRVLEIGCGRGVGAEILLDRFGAASVYGIDLDPAMILLAQKRLRRFGDGRLRLEVGDVEKIPANANSFDVVFDFGIIHHVPHWQVAVAEVSRVLRPGGRFFFEEVTKHALDRWLCRTFLTHPTENRFTTGQFIAELESRGILVGGNFQEKFFGDFVLGVGVKSFQIK